jgi:tetratricopeptide (TPR) repeat protein
MRHVFFVVCVFALLFAAGTLFAQDQPREEPKEQPKEEPKEEKKKEEDEDKTLTWESDLETALKKAKEKDTMVMIYFYIEGNKNLADYEKNIVNQPAVVELSEKFVCLKVEKNKEKKISEKFQASSVPQVLFITGDPKKLGRIVGYVKREEFVEKVKEVYESIEIEKKTREILQKDPGNLAANLELGKVYIIREMREVAIHCLKKVVDGDPKNKKGLLVEAAFRLGFLQYNNGMYKLARDNFKKVRKHDVLDEKGFGDDMLAAEAHMCMKERDFEQAIKKWRLFTVKYSDSELMSDALFYLGGAYYRLRKNKEALETWEKLVKEYPNADRVGQAKYYIQTLKKEMKKK